MLLAGLVALAGGAARAQSTGDSVVVSVLTMGPGEEIFERFGHQSIRMHDVTTGSDTSYNWGMFDFDQPHFLKRFLTGDTKYWMEGFPTESILAYYKRSGRAVWEQELALSGAQKDSLWRFLRWNAQEEHKWYRYDYYADNCATRVRDALDMVLGGAIRHGIAGREHDVTLRSETLRLARAYPLINFGMDFVLGRPADATLAAWGEMFVPMRLQELIRPIRIHHEDQTTGPLVLSERQLVVDARYQDSDTPPDYFASALMVAIPLAGVLLALAVFGGGAPAARWSIAVIGSLWSLLAGLVGVLLLCAELFTRHAAYMGHNVNVLLATPASLALAVMLPMAMRSSAPAWTVRGARSLALFAAACAALAVLLRPVPWFSQENRPLLALAVPVHAALAYALWRVNNARSGERH